MQSKPHRGGLALHGRHNTWFDCVSIDNVHFYPAQVQSRAERPDDIIGEIGLLGIPHEPNGDDLRTVQEHPANLNALTAVALQRKREEIMYSQCIRSRFSCLTTEKNYPESTE